ncbi:MAG: nicotinamide mononucleotide transporter [Methylophaga sp.]|nr:MAG: nicotinamide mononucleotide transporter [Methylophaga sp.]
MIDADLTSTVINALLTMSGWEVIASLLGIGYAIFAARESQWCWPLAFISTLIYTLLFWEGQLPMQALLNFYYMGMAIYGYLLWRKHGHTEDDLPITSWAWSQQILFLITGAILTIITAYYLQAINASQSPYLDAGVTVFSVLNMILMAKKILQSWLYWIVIDTAAITLYVQNGYYATIVMFCVYLILAVMGFISWQKFYRQQTS